MFLDVLCRRNPKLIEQAIALHQAGNLPANSYVIDLDAVEANARTIKTAADRLGLKVFAMTKQMSRSPSFCKAVARGGIGKAVAVDMEDALDHGADRKRELCAQEKAAQRPVVRDIFLLADNHKQRRKGIATITPRFLPVKVRASDPHGPQLILASAAWTS